VPHHGEYGRHVTTSVRGAHTGTPRGLGLAQGSHRAVPKQVQTTCTAHHRLCTHKGQRDSPRGEVGVARGSPVLDLRMPKG
jgi:hypothetical protein